MNKLYKKIYRNALIQPKTRSRAYVKKMLVYLIQLVLNTQFLRACANRVLLKTPRLRNKLSRMYHFNQLRYMEVQKQENEFKQCAFILARAAKKKIKSPRKAKLKLCIVSPLPNAPSGVASLVAMLVEPLTNYYDIVLISDQTDVSDELNEKYIVRDPDFFKKNAAQFDRVLYHMGNNLLHDFELSLLDMIPGVVILHDIYYPRPEHSSVDRMYLDYGWSSFVKDDKLFYNNIKILRNSIGIITHSEYAKKLLIESYSDQMANKIMVAPLTPNIKPTTFKHDNAKKQLGYDEDEILICSFGFLRDFKCNLTTVKALAKAGIFTKFKARLIFVGEGESDYVTLIEQTAKELCVGKFIKVTGYLAKEDYEIYAQAADIGIQLRQNSFGETSGTLLECMVHGIPTIVNAYGSFAEFPSQAVYMLREEFSEAELGNAVVALLNDKQLCALIADNAIERASIYHSAENAALSYYQGVEHFYEDFDRRCKAIRKKHLSTMRHKEQIAAMKKIFPLIPAQKRIFFDITALVFEDLKTGIQRILRAQFLSLMKYMSYGYRVELVYIAHDSANQVNYAHDYAANFLGVPVSIQSKEVIFNLGDIYFVADLNPDVYRRAGENGFFTKLRNKGVYLIAQIYDLLPATHPHFFPENADFYHARWLDVACTCFNEVLCISDSVAKELRRWIRQRNLLCLPNFSIGRSYMGADLNSSSPSMGMPSDADKTLQKIKNKITFLMVGTIEPRKGHLQAIAAFAKLWHERDDINLVIVGKRGWDDGLYEEVQKSIHHKNLFFLGQISDEYLEKIYEASDCLLYASEAEGLGLPLLEAANKKLSIIARNIPVFKEVAGEHAYYFADSLSPDVIAEAINAWVLLFKAGKHPSTSGMSSETWEVCSARLMDALLRHCGVSDVAPNNELDKFVLKADATEIA